MVTKSQTYNLPTVPNTWTGNILLQYIFAYTYLIIIFILNSIDTQIVRDLRDSVDREIDWLLM